MKGARGRRAAGRFRGSRNAEEPHLWVPLSQGAHKATEMEIVRVVQCVVLKKKVVGGESLAHKEEKGMVGIWAFGVANRPGVTVGPLLCNNYLLTL